MLSRFLVPMVILLTIIAPAAGVAQAPSSPPASDRQRAYDHPMDIDAFNSPEVKGGSKVLEVELETYVTERKGFLGREMTPHSSTGWTDLRINEFMADNESTLRDPDDPDPQDWYEDWFEIYNTGMEEVDLQGLYLTDDLNSPTKFQVTQSITVPALGFALFWADGETAQGPNHVNFALSTDGEAIGIFSGTQPIDTYIFGAQTADVSEGRYPDGADNWVFYTTPTPGGPNLQAPIISGTARTPVLPTAADTVTVTTHITDEGTVLTTTLYYSATGSGFTAMTMNSLGGDLYAAQIPPQTDGSRVQYYVFAGDNDDQLRSDPPDAPDTVYEYIVGYQPPTLFINEFMADNQTGLQDPDEPGTFPDWVELYNPGPDPVDLGGKYLTDNVSEPTRFRITDSVTISAGGFLIFYADNAPEQGPFHTNFGLRTGGESIGLFDSGIGGNLPLDTYTFGPQTADVSQGRCPDGGDQWLLFTSPTPGATNEPCGAPPIISRTAHTPTLPSQTDAVTVTATITDDGVLVSATLYYSATGSGFISVTMTPLGNDLYAATIPPHPDGTWVAYYLQAEDNGGFSITDPLVAPTNTYRYLVGYQLPTVYLNEFMADNDRFLEDPDEPGEFPDWIELYNPGPAPVDLGGLYLTDELADPTQFRITDSLTIPVEGFVLFWADRNPEQGPLHTNFRLDASGETIGLFGALGTVPIDVVTFTTQITNVTFGRLPDGTGAWSFLDCPTPGRPNDECYRIYLPLMIREF